jgi:hypothetical protein
MEKVKAEDVIPQRIRLTKANGFDVDWQDVDYFLDTYKKRYDLQLNPDFQRGHVWTQEQQIAYIEFIMSGGNSGKDIYFNCPGYGYDTTNQTMVCVDGLQRITAVSKFIKNEFKILGKYYAKDFIGMPTNCSFLFKINNLSNRADVLCWYLEMNTGGIVHSKEEIERVQKLLNKEMGKNE